MRQDKLAKFGYQRKTLRDLRGETEARRAAEAATTSTTRKPPAPTKRTNARTAKRR